MSYTVYMHILPNNKRYIGITKQTLEGRFKNSLGYGTQQLFWRAIQKYGWDNIKHEVIAEGLTHDEACELEVFYIAKYKTNNPKYGYNRTSGGDGTCNFSHKNPHDDNWKKKVSIANTGKKRTIEARQKMREAKLGTHWSDERKQAYSKSQRERGFKPSKQCIEASIKKRSIPIYVYENNNLIGSYKNITSAAKDLGVSVSYISLCLSGKLKTNKYKFIRRIQDEL